MESPPTALCTVERLHELHAATMRARNQSPTPAREGCLESSVGAARSAGAYASEDEADEGLVFAAAILLYLTKNHCFGDGNKRVAWAAVVEVLLVLGLTVDATEIEAADFVLDLAARERPAIQDVLAWLTPRLIAADEAKR
jgi:death-on-curing protein